VQGASAFLGISLNTTYSLFRNGDLPGRKVGREWLTTKPALLRWVEVGSSKLPQTGENNAPRRGIPKRKVGVRSKQPMP
jgi:excisionase family DNA binding protein